MANQWLFKAEKSDKENDEKTKLEELFVFGYACKIFRDDAQAKQVDTGTYMIPWNGDERLRIDRYDGRGHLYDLSEYDADKRKGQPPPELTEDEKRIEAFCDEERYLELRTDLAEKTMYEEEEWKRYYESLSEGYKAVGFSYDYNGQPQYAESEAPNEDPEDQVYVPVPELQVPDGVMVPPTVKHNNIVEKTAKFIAEHGIQMEIMMKTKQASNSQFDFMHFEDELYAYFRHMVSMITAKKYTPKTLDKEKEEKGEEDAHMYLHPTLMTSSRASPTPEVDKPVVIQMPKVSIHETSYGQLLQSFSKVNQDVAQRLKPKSEARTGSPEPTMLPACMAQGGYGPTHGTVPLPPGIEPVTLPTNGDDKQPPREEIHVDESEVSHIVPPPPDIQPVIDRMAMYVARNGVEFEIVVKSKKDPRFQFLESWHANFLYYDFKKNLFTQEIEKNRKSKEKDEKENEEEEEEKCAANKGVKFKVKAKDPDQKSVVDQKQIFEYETSEDEDGGESSEGQKDKPHKGDVSRSASRTVTPIKDLEPKVELPPEVREKKQAEQRLKDRLAQNAREKLTQVKKEEQLKADRKRKAALFINMLKGSAPIVGRPDDTPTSDQTPTPTPSQSGTTTPVPVEPTHHHKSSRSKHKHRGRSSRSRSRSPSSKKHKREATPPSAYTIVRRSPLRRPPPPPPPRNRDIRRERSPSGSRSSRHRSRSPSSRSKSKKKKRSKSPTSHDHRHKRSSKKKKKRSRSPHRKSSRRDKSSSSDRPEATSAPVTEEPDTTRVVSPVREVATELEEGETRDSSLEPGEIDMEVIDEIGEDINGTESPVRKSPSKSRSRSRSISRVSRSRSRSISKAKSRSRSNSRSKSRSQSRSDSSDSVDLVRSLASPSSPVSSPARSRSRSPVDNDLGSRSGLSTPDRLANGGESNASSLPDAATSDVPKKDVSKYMLSRVRAMIKASREAILKEDREENIFDDP